MSSGRQGAGRSWRQVGVLSGIGLTLVLCTVLGLAGGYALDGWLGTRPWLTLIGLLLGIASGFLNLFRAVGLLDPDPPDREERP